MSDKKQRPNPICYLCNRTVERHDLSRDHVPPEQIYGKVYKQQDIAKNLFTLPAHKACNKAFQHDEDYFVMSLAPVVGDSEPGRELWNDLARRMRRPEAAALNQKIRDEFIRESTDKVTLPEGKVGKTYEGDRVRRVIWKILRGLYWREFERFLPEHVFDLRIRVVSPFADPPAEIAELSASPSKGQYPLVFDYRFRVAPELNNFNYWGLLFWDRIIVTVQFHDPDCRCTHCASRRPQAH